MKKINVFIVVLVVCLLSFSLVRAVGSDTPQIQVTLLSQSPDPVEPGQVVKVKFKVENEGWQSAVDNIIKVIPKFPFTLYGDEAEKNIGKLRAEQTGADAVIVEFNLKVDEKAVEGEAEVELMVKVTEEAWISYTDDELMVDIQTHDAVLDIMKITSEPEEVAPGGTAKISFLVKNLADSLLKDIRFKLDFGSSTLPLAPDQSSSERRIFQLETGHQKPLVFKVRADPEAGAGLYKVPLNITYNDEKGNSYLVEDVLAVIVGKKPDLQAYIKKSGVLEAGKAGKVTLEVANTGTTDVKFLELKVLDSDDFELISTSDYYYIGDVDSDDTESEEIEIFVKGELDGLVLPVFLEYYDANNKPFQQRVELELNLYSSKDLKKFGLVEKSKIWVYGVVLVLIGGGYVWYRRRKKNKNGKR